MKNKPFAIFTLACFFTLGPQLSPAFAQGSLTPPGAPNPMMKTLAQIEPRTPVSALPMTISNAGSYYLTSNLTGLSGTNGITVLASDVLLDLNGFALIGVPGALAGINSTAPATGLTVRNGIIRNWPVTAINAVGSDATFEGVNVYSNSGSFALSAGANAKLRSCTLAWNSGGGVSVGSGSVVSDSVLHNNGGNGLLAGEAAAVRNCTILSNSANGVVLGNASLLEGCVIRANGQNGVLGFTSVLVERCIISQNNSNGITLELAGRITDCVLTSNRVDGIRVSSRSTITGNLIDSNGTTGKDAGIRLLSTDSRVEDNNLVNNRTGLLSDAGYNLISRNKATINTTNYTLHPSDAAGPITANPTSAGPWVNFTF
jgi:hypothetical protein